MPKARGTEKGGRLSFNVRDHIQRIFSEAAEQNRDRELRIVLGGLPVIRQGQLKSINPRLELLLKFGPTLPKDSRRLRLCTWARPGCKQ